MEHLFSSRVKVQRMQTQVAGGTTAVSDWYDQTGILADFPCRLDLVFIRPGKDVLPPINAGVAKDRIGVLFCMPYIPLQPGDHIVTISGPVTGTFEIKSIPDKALDFSEAHHIEVQIVETNQTLEQTDPTPFPSEDGPPEAIPPLDE